MLRDYQIFLDDTVEKAAIVHFSMGIECGLYQGYSIFKFIPAHVVSDMEKMTKDNFDDRLLGHLKKFYGESSAPEILERLHSLITKHIEQRQQKGDRSVIAVLFG